MIAGLQQVRACVFDAYGTLFDVDAVARGLQAQLGAHASALTDLWRAKQLQYTWLRTAQSRHADFAQVTRQALDYALQDLALDHALAAPLLAAFDALPVFGDVPATLARLRAAGYRLAVLSNGTPAMLQGLLGRAGIEGELDAVISVEEVAAFKPHPTVYQRAAARLALEPERICFVSANGWDACAAAASGMTVVWCNRQARPPERLPGAIAAEIASLAELPPLLAAQRPSVAGR